MKVYHSLVHRKSDSKLEVVGVKNDPLHTIRRVIVDNRAQWYEFGVHFVFLPSKLDHAWPTRVESRKAACIDSCDLKKSGSGTVRWSLTG